MPTFMEHTQVLKNTYLIKVYVYVILPIYSLKTPKY